MTLSSRKIETSYFLITNYSYNAPIIKLFKQFKGFKSIIIIVSICVYSKQSEL